MSWHTKYRPRAVSQLHLTEVREVLLQLMKSGSFPQVFLCAGPKGTGKTSTSRIIGAMLNDEANIDAVTALFFEKKGTAAALKEPQPDSPLADKIFNGQSYIVQEMDAASNRGIDDVRQLKERVSLPPQEGLVSVFILDEVHMLTKEAFNALLKLLEEPPAHAVFILATTELHKVPDTVQSRCAVLPFRKATNEELKAALQKVIEAEKIKIDAGAIEVIVAHADGSFRDAIKHLEMVVTAHSAKENITLEKVHAVLQTGFSTQIPELISLVVTKNETKLVEQFAKLRASGVSTTVFHVALIDYLHQQLMIAVLEGDNKAAFSQRISHFLLTELQDIPTVTIEPLPLLSIELKMLDIIYRAKDKSGGGSKSSGPTTKKAAKENAAAGVNKAAPIITKKEAQAMPVELTVPETQEEQTEISGIEISEPLTVHQNVEMIGHVDTLPLLNAWAEFIAAVETTNSTLGAVLRSAKPLPELSNGIAKVEVYYPFHRDQLMQPKFMDVLKKCAEPFVGGSATFEFVIGKQSSAPSLTADDSLAAIAASILM